MERYCKKSVVIEAIKFVGDNWVEIQEWMYKYGNMFKTCEVDKDGNVIAIIIKTFEGEIKVNIGDYIIKGVKNEFYPCKPDIFEVTYEKINNEEWEKMSKIDKEKPKYYEQMAYEPIDFMYNAKLNIYTAKVFKYLVRYPFKHKNKTIDLRKALYTIEKFKDKLYISDYNNLEKNLKQFVRMNQNLIHEKHFLVIHNFFIAVFNNRIDDFIKILKRTIKEEKENECNGN